MYKAIAIVAIGVLLVAGIAYNLQPRSSGLESRRVAAAEAVRVSTAPVTLREVNQLISLNGVLKTDRQAVVAALLPLRVLQVLVRNGDRVKSGQTVVIVDSRGSDAQMQQSDAGVDAAEAALQKAIDGKHARLIEMDANVAQARSGLAFARTKLSQADLGAALTESSADSDARRAAAGVKQAAAGLHQAEIGYKQAAETLKRVRFLYSKGGVSRAEMEGAESQAEIARAQKDAAESALEQAQAAEKPTRESQPLRTKVSLADVQSARAGVKQAEDALRAAVQSRKAVLRLADRDIEAARSQVRQALAGRNQASSTAISGTLTSPSNGIVADVSVHSGDIAQPGQPLVTVLGDGPLYFEAAVPARNSADLRLGAMVRVVLDTGKRLRGTVRRVLPLTQDGRTIPVQIALPNSPRGLVSGTSGQAELQVIGSRMVTIPADAIRIEEGKPIVFVAMSGVATRREVTPGGERDGLTEIRSGLAAGESVIVSVPADLKPGDRIEIMSP